MNRTITALILIALAIGIYVTVTQSEVTVVKATSAVNAQYTSALANAAQLIKARDKVLTDYNNISALDRDRLQKMLPTSVDNIRLIIDLNNVALRHGFSLRNIKADVPSNGTGSGSTPQNGSSLVASSTLSTVQVSFSVTAPYQQFISFLQDVEANLRIMDVSHLSVTANDTGTYDFAVQLTTYWLRQ